LLLEHLRGDEHGSVAGRRQQSVFGSKLFGEAEVADSDRISVTCELEKVLLDKTAQ
jgi:hypothetical protein